MHRQLKLRAKSKESKEWLHGNLVVGMLNTFIIQKELIVKTDFFINKDFVATPTIWRHFVIETETIGQLTEFKDKNGNEIYEGDLLKVVLLHSNGKMYEYITDVRFEDGSFVIRGEESKRYDTYLAAYINPTSPLVELEVIGNIHDNPELPKGGGNEA